MLDPTRVDLSSIAEALESHGYRVEWYVDPNTGECQPWNDDMDLDGGSPSLRGHITVEPIESAIGYRDMVEFTSAVRDQRARDLLERAIEGRGAFRRFKDTLGGLDDLRGAWFEFHRARMQQRSVEWLIDHELVDEATGGRLVRDLEPTLHPPLFGPSNTELVIAEIGSDLRELFGSRLHKLILFGSWARGDATEDSDLDLLVVLDPMEDRLTERLRMDDLLWRHTIGSGIVITTMPVSRHRFEHPDAPVLFRAREEGRVVA